jgi:aspartyl-tRNA(Asn)/glutamyl-tRNA(Gln) amidotransferase subunit A
VHLEGAPVSRPWHWASAAEIAGEVSAGRASAVEVVQAHLDRIAALDGKLGCFLRTDPSARAQAEAVDRRVAAGEAPPLAGVPVGLKDLFVTRGLETTAGSKILAGWIPPYEATCVERLKRAGAVVVGKTNMDEFAMGSSNENSAFGPVRNPWDPTRVPGGSSGGSAAAVAAGLCTIALGTDTGGSIRQPAALCGVTGLKPTYGRVSRRGVVAFASSLDQVGPLARSAEDCARALAAIAGHDPADATSIDRPLDDYLAACETPLAGLRIGRFDQGMEGLDPAVQSKVDQGIAKLWELGATPGAVRLDHVGHALSAYYLIAPAEASSNLARYDGVRYGLRESGRDLAETYARTRGKGFGAEVKRRILLGTYALRAGYYDAYYLRAQKVRELIRRDFERAFAEFDLIATPTSPVPAFELGSRTADPTAMYLADIYTVPVNLAGLPAQSIPCEPVGGLPVGLQLIAPPLGEAALLRAAAAYQRATEWHTRHPDLAS